MLMLHFCTKWPVRKGAIANEANACNSIASASRMPKHAKKANASARIVIMMIGRPPLRLEKIKDNSLDKRRVAAAIAKRITVRKTIAFAITVVAFVTKRFAIAINVITT